MLVAVTAFGAALVVPGVAMAQWKPSFPFVLPPPPPPPPPPLFNQFGSGPSLTPTLPLPTIPTPKTAPTPTKICPALLRGGSYLDFGWDLLRAQKYREAIDMLECAGDSREARQGLAHAYHSLAHLSYEKKLYDGIASNLSMMIKYAETEARKLAFSYAQLVHAEAEKAHTDAKQAHAEQRFNAAIRIYSLAGNNPESLNAIAGIEFGRGRIEEALDAAKKLAGIDAKRGALLKGDILLQTGAVPLAVEAYRHHERDPNVAKLLEHLKQNGLDQFRELTTNSGVMIYETVAPKGFERILRYMFQVSNSSPKPFPVAVLSVRPAPRPLTLRLAWRAGKDWRLPVADAAVEYWLTLYARDFVGAIHIWDEKPTEEKIMAAMKLGLGALKDMQQGEQLLHSKNPAQSLSYFKRAAGLDRDAIKMDEGLANYNALVNGVRAAVAADDRPSLEAFYRALDSSFPYWGRMSWASILTETNREKEARAIFQQLAEDWPRRHEALEKLADLEWNNAQAKSPEARAAAILHLQTVLHSVLERRPTSVAALVRLAQVHAKLGSYALAIEALDRISVGERTGEVNSLRNFLAQVGQDAFDDLGKIYDPRKNFGFRVFKAHHAPPARATVIHHSVEIAVFDGKNRHIETFTLSSQGLADDQPRKDFLDRNSNDGLETIARYDKNLPDAMELARWLATQ